MRTFAGSAGLVLALSGQLCLVQPAEGRLNPDAHLALDMMSRSRTQSCASLAERYLSCDSIRASLPDTGRFRGAVVLYNVESVTAVQFALSWPADWEIESFTPCGTLTIGGEITTNPMDVSTAWSTPQTATGSQGIIVGLLTGHATSPGRITFTPPTYPGGLTVVDGEFQPDSIQTVFEGCVGTAPSGNPCDMGELQAGFEASVTQGAAPLEVAFTDRSRGGATSWLWEFGDRTTSTERNPRHTYTESGTYTVRLRAESGEAIDELERAAYIIVSETASPGEIATDTYFTWKPTGLERFYDPRGDEVIVEFKDVVDSAAITSLGAEHNLSVVAAGVLGHTWALYQLPTSDGADTLAAELQQDTARVANALPVMQTESGIPSYFLPGAIALRFEDGLTEAEQDSVLTDAGSTILERYRIPGCYCVSKPASKSLFGAIRTFSDLPEMQWAEPLHFSPVSLVQGYHPDDLGLSNQWALYNDGTHGTAGADIKAYNPDQDSVGAWDFTLGDRSVVIADLDISFDLNHPDLAGNILDREHRDWRFDGHDPSNCPDSLIAVTDSCRSPIHRGPGDSHGTSTAGIAAATADGATDSTQAMVGVAPGCWLLPLGIPTIEDSAWVADSTTYEPILMEAVNYAANYIVDTLQLRGVMSMSWGHCTIGDWEGLHGELDRAFEKGMVLVAARGHWQGLSGPCGSPTVPTYPAAWESVISVTSTDSTDLKGPRARWGSTVSVAAPGSQIYTTRPPGADSSASSWHWLFSGTSAAAPHVAGLAALILSKNGALSPSGVRDIIQQTADRVHASTDTTSMYYYRSYGDSAAPDSVKCLALGYGRVNARAALQVTTTDVAGDAFRPLLSKGNTMRRIRGRPVPFHLGEGVRLTFAAPAGRRLELGIYDAAGRRVRTLPQPTAIDGEQAVYWDGRDSAGRLVSPGVYFAVVSGGGARASHKLVAVR